jgi:GDP-L-fucose synthase
MNIFITGHKGMVGSSITSQLFQKYKSNNSVNIYTVDRQDLNLLDQAATLNFFKSCSFDLVVDCAAKVGGIHSNNLYRSDFIYENLEIQNNIIHSSYLTKVKKLLFLGSSCIYPKFAEQPLKEEYLLASPLEYTNEPYAVAKIAGIKMCESYYKQYGCNFISVMPTNLYGPNDNFHPDNSHVLPGLMHKFHLAKIKNQPSVEVWGTGKAKREFMHVDDMANACLNVIDKLDAKDLYAQNVSHINIGSGEEISIYDLAHMIAKTVGYQGEINFDLSKPDGTLRKYLESSRLKRLGFECKIPLEKGLRSVYDWYLLNEQSIKK